MDVLLGLIWGIVLDDPVDAGNVEPARRHVGAQEDTLVRCAEAVVGRAPRRLLLLPVDADHRDVDVIQQLIVELHGIAGREEDHDLLVSVLLQECEQQQEAALGRYDDVALCQPGHGCHVVLRLHLHEDRLRERESRQVRDLPRLRRREERRLPLLWQELYNHVDLLLESDLQNAVSFVDGQIHQVVEHKPLGVLHVVEKPTRSGH
mmetsp:Transcript_58731/g.182443  ORF Transcript_58731/g.182443 Transcript_58731/m.182443 type:complete len:206 (+) Transcript_58731:630-1247(+)